MGRTLAFVARTLSPALDILFLATAPSQFLGLEIASLTYLALLPEFVALLKANAVVGVTGSTGKTTTKQLIAAGYAFYHLLDARQNLSNLGVTAFVATLQFLPGVLSLLYWQTANHRGFIAGLLVGMAVWLIGMMLPMLGDLQGVHLPLLDVAYALDDTSWHLVAIASLASNVLVFSLVSIFTEPSVEERSAGEACAVDNVRRPQRRELLATSAQAFADQLARPLGAKIAQREVKQALRDLHLPFDESRPFALRRLRDLHRGRLGERVAEQAGPRRLEVLHQHEGHAGVVR